MTTKTARQVLPPEDPRHGSPAGFAARCRCLPCRLARNQWKLDRDRRIAYGTWQPFADAGPVREHLRKLSKAGIGTPRVAELADLSRDTVKHIILGNGNRRPPRKVRRRTADAILAIQPTLDAYADNANVPAIGTVRRLRALVRAGYPMRHLANLLPGHPDAALRVIRNGPAKVKAKVARAARDLYDTLPVPDDTDQAQRASGMAEARGWAPMGAWDVDTIDDPSSLPNLGEPAEQDADAQDVDEVLVRRVLAGHAPLDALNEPERVALWRVWERHRSDNQLDGPGFADFARTYNTTKAIAERFRNNADGLNSRGKPRKTTSNAATGRTTERTAA